MIQTSYDNKPSLYLIPTPIGNLEDITIRSLNLLKEVDFILCEDTRSTKKLLNQYNIANNNLISCHEYNEEKVVDQVINKLQEGYNIGLVTDQGTPIISDPGYYISREVIKTGYNVIGLPGATAFVPALIMSGIEPSPFLYYGFLSAKKTKQINELKSLKSLKYTIIIYESVHRLKDTLTNMLDIFGNRKIALCREISKIHEEVIRGSIQDVLNNITVLKGEFVIIVEGNKELIDFSSLSIIEHVKLYTEDGISEKDAIKKVAKERNVPKSYIYNEYHNRGD